MKLFIKAMPGAGEELVEKIDDAHFTVWVKEPPVRGRANAAIAKALADYFGVSSSRVRILQGHTSRSKLVEIV